jgi:hypothetical protein
MAVFVSDSFTDTTGTALGSHTGETGATWTKHPDYSGDAVISDANRVRSSSAGGVVIYYASGTPTSAEYDVEADLVVKDVVNAISGVQGRMNTVTGDNHYDFRYNYFSLQWSLHRYVAGVETLLGTYSQTLSDEQSYALKLELRDAAKKCYVDGVERISSADNAVTAAGKAGLLMYRDAVGNTVGLHLDNFVATDLSGAAGQPTMRHWGGVPGMLGAGRIGRSW